MEFLGKTREETELPEGGHALYRALLAGDLPAAWLLARPMIEKEKTASLSFSDAFNCGLCLYRLREYEKALAEFRRAEQSLGNPPDFSASEKKLFLQALSIMESSGALLPFEPDASKELDRYGLIRVRQLRALCLIRLGRSQEAAPLIRFLSQYPIELPQ